MDKSWILGQLGEISNCLTCNRSCLFSKREAGREIKKEIDGGGSPAFKLYMLYSLANTPHTESMASHQLNIQISSKFYKGFLITFMQETEIQDVRCGLHFNRNTCTPAHACNYPLSRKCVRYVSRALVNVHRMQLDMVVGARLAGLRNHRNC